MCDAQWASHGGVIAHLVRFALLHEMLDIIFKTKGIPAKIISTFNLAAVPGSITDLTSFTS
jgi:hypothetical protein